RNRHGITHHGLSCPLHRRTPRNHAGETTWNSGGVLFATPMKSKTKTSHDKEKRPRKAPTRTPLLHPKPQASNSRSGDHIADSKENRPDVIRILVVDDHPLFRHGLVQLLSSDDGFSVCGERSTSAEALRRIRQLI